MYAHLAYQNESIDYAEAGTITLPDAPDCVVARIEPHAVQLASGDHRYDLDHDLGRLFAAAPDLLAALTVILQEVPRLLNASERVRFSAAKNIKGWAETAIAKAEGR